MSGMNGEQIKQAMKDQAKGTGTFHAAAEVARSAGESIERANALLEAYQQGLQAAAKGKAAAAAVQAPTPARARMQQTQAKFAQHEQSIANQANQFEHNQGQLVDVVADPASPKNGWGAGPTVLAPYLAKKAAHVATDAANRIVYQDYSAKSSENAQALPDPYDTDALPDPAETGGAPLIDFAGAPSNGFSNAMLYYRDGSSTTTAGSDGGSTGGGGSHGGGMSDAPGTGNQDPRGNPPHNPGSAPPPGLGPTPRPRPVPPPTTGPPASPVPLPPPVLMPTPPRPPRPPRIDPPLYPIAPPPDDDGHFETGPPKLPTGVDPIGTAPDSTHASDLGDAVARPVGGFGGGAVGGGFANGLGSGWSNNGYGTGGFDLSGGAGGAAGAAGGATGARLGAGQGGALLAAESAASRAGGARGGMGGMAPMAGARGARKEDDDEHKLASYLITEEHGNEIVGDLPPTAPPVIGA